MAFFRGEAPIVDREHFVVSVEWNKGIVASDGSEGTLFTVKMSLWGLFVLLLLLCGALWFKFGKDPRPRVSIPLFYPPLGPDGMTLSPAAMAYIRESARLTSRGFSALLLNLAAQKLVDMTGTGSRKEPYVLQTSDEILKRVPADDADREGKTTGEKSSQEKPVVSTWRNGSACAGSFPPVRPSLWKWAGRVPGRWPRPAPWPIWPWPPGTAVCGS